MNTKFNILWLEDADDWYPAARSKIEKYIEIHNFIPHITRLISPDEEAIKATENIRYDLVLVDYDLKNKTRGSDGIRALRDNNVWADVIFYTSKSLGALEDEMKSQILEGVYRTSRVDPYFSDKVKNIIDKIIKRSEDIINIRGMVMDYVSEFDTMLRKIIEKYLSIADSDEDFAFINTYAKKIVHKSIDDAKKQADKIEADAFYVSVMDTLLIDSSKLSRVVNKLFKTRYPNCEEMKNFHYDYEETILKERNNLAHAKKKDDSTGAFSFIDKDGKETVYDSTKCSEIRAAINKYGKLLVSAIDYVE